MQTLERRELLAGDLGLAATSSAELFDPAAWLGWTAGQPGLAELSGFSGASGLSGGNAALAEGEDEPTPPPIAVDDHYVTQEDTPLVVNATSPDPVLLANDLGLTDQPGRVSVWLVNQPQFGSVEMLLGDGEMQPEGLVAGLMNFTGSFRYSPNVGYNQLDSFTYRLVVLPDGWEDVSLIDEDGMLSESWEQWLLGNGDIYDGTVQIDIQAVNDPPQFTLDPEADFTERNQEELTIWPAVLDDILPGRPVALDELATQDVTVELLVDESLIPASLFVQTPEVVPHYDDNGKLVAADLQFIAQPHQWGTALLVLQISDDDPDAPQHRRATVTLNIHPVNDPPIANPAVQGETDERDQDHAYRVAAADPSGAPPMVTYVMAEDRELFIPLRRPAGVVGYNPVGILDLMLPGPANEIAPGPGGGQTLAVDWPVDEDGQPLTLASEQGGQVTPVYDADELIGFRYQPRQDFNSGWGIIDRLPAFPVTDRGADGLESWDPETGEMVSDPQTSSVIVQVEVNPVNDRPQFELNETTVNVIEDSGDYRFPLFANNVFGGPPESAFDELNQTVTFSLTGTSSGVEKLFEVAPEISGADGGWALTFRPAADQYGTAVFEVRATDDGPDNAIRGDLVSSEPQYLVINIRPANDAPTLLPDADLTFQLNEDALVLQSDGSVAQQPVFIPLRGTAARPGLLDVFTAGPENETSPTAPAGNQQIYLADSFPSFTTGGGRLLAVYDPNDAAELIGYHYFPKANFNGQDSFIYGVVDDGLSMHLDGTTYSDPQTAFTTVRLNVSALNDRPQFSGPVSVTVEEDSMEFGTAGLAVFPQFVTEIMAGPAGALDELDPLTGQTVSFVITPAAGNPAGLFRTPPQVSSDGTLTFRTAADANGQAVFTIHASDNGPSNPPLEHRTSAARTFTITVQAVNDAPLFTPTTDHITTDEDSGPYTSTEPYAIDISPGPADEVAAGQTVRFEVSVAAGDEQLFQALPTVTDTGFLRFTPSENAVGVTVVSVVAIDSQGASSEAVPLTITIQEVNDRPVAGSVDLHSDEDSLLTIPLRQLIEAAHDPDLETNPDEFLEVVQLAGTSQAGAIVSLDDQGNILYDPRGAQLIQSLQAGQTLVDTFSYRIRDAGGLTSNAANVSITLAGINDAPTVVDDRVTLSLSGQTRIDPLANDFDVDGNIDRTTLRIESLPAFGTAEIQSDGSLLYIPFANFRGTDALSYTVADNLGLRSELAWITIDRNAQPIAVDDAVQTYWGEPIDIAVTDNDVDPDGQLDVASVEIVTHPLNGTAAVLANGLVRYLPNSGFAGTETFRYTVRDNQGLVSVPAEVRVQVLASRLQNPGNRFDVNASGEVSPLDALLILNRLSQSSREGQGVYLPVEDLLGEQPRRYYDTDGDRFVGLTDVLVVLNELARQRQINLPAAEGENRLATPAIDSPIDSLTGVSGARGVTGDRGVSGDRGDDADRREAAWRQVSGDDLRQSLEQTLQQLAADSRDRPGDAAEQSDRQPALDAVLAQWDLIDEDLRL